MPRPSFPHLESIRHDTFRNLRFPSVPLEEKFPRLVKRNLPFDQSKNKVHIEHRHKRSDLYRLIRRNWFHVLLRMKTQKSLFILLVSWTCLVLFFAGLYYAVDRANPNVDCGLGNAPGIPIAWHGAFAFSLETCTTVGYGLPGSTNAFFENCPGIQVVIYFQMVLSMISNAFFLAFLFARLAKSESRAIQVVFSKTCVVRITERGTVVWQFRVYDVDVGHGIVEAHVRLYALLKHKDTDGHPQLVPLRIESPNDDLGATLFLSIPSVVTHEVDYYSPLYTGSKGKYRLSSGGLGLREVDSITGNREEVCCPICGETYGDFDRLRNHVKYNQLVEKKDDIPVEGSHQELAVESLPTQFPRPTLEELEAELPLQELICVVEGIDPLTSGTFQALQSYMPEDIDWGARFVPCLTSTTALSSTFVDLERFHQTEPCSEHADSERKKAAEEEEKHQEAANEPTGNGGDEQV